MFIDLDYFINAKILRLHLFILLSFRKIHQTASFSMRCFKTCHNASSYIRIWS